MGLTFDNPNNLNKMLNKFAVVPDPKKKKERTMDNIKLPDDDKKKKNKKDHK